MSFLELPLVLARDIIEMVAERLNSCKGLTQFLQLRLVDSKYPGSQFVGGTARCSRGVQFSTNLARVLRTGDHSMYS